MQIPEFGTLATKGYFIGTPLRDLLFGSSRGSGGSKEFLQGSVWFRIGHIGDWELILTGLQRWVEVSKFTL